MTEVGSSRRWWILGVICLAQLMDVLDVTIVNIALPHAQQELRFSEGDRQWIVTAYALAFGSLLLLFGRVCDLIGRRRMLLIGLALFAVASAVGGAAPSFGVLVTARALQGTAGAMIAPAALSLLATTFTEKKARATAFAVFGTVSGSGAAVGMLLGGLLTEFLSWRYTLYVNVFIAIAAILGTIFLIPRQAREDTRPRLDMPGTLLVCAGLFCIVFGFSSVDSHGWTQPPTWGFLAAGLALLVAFLWWQSRSQHPLLPLRVLLNRTRGGANLAIFISGIGLFGAFLFVNYYMQLVLHLTPLLTGLAFLPMVATIVIAGGISTTQLYYRVGPKVPITAGMIIAAAAMVWMTRIGSDSSYAIALLGPLAMLGIGIGATIAPAMNAGTSGVRQDDAGIASATVNVSQQIGGAVGTAFLNSLAAATMAAFLVGRDATSNTVQTDAAIQSYIGAFWATSAIFLVGAVLCGVLIPNRRPEPALIAS